MQKRITVALIKRTSDVQTLQVMWEQLAEKAYYMVANTRNFDELVEYSVVFHSIQTRWELVNNKLSGMNLIHPDGVPYRELDFSDMIC